MSSYADIIKAAAESRLGIAALAMLLAFLIVRLMPPSPVKSITLPACLVFFLVFAAAAVFFQVDDGRVKTVRPPQSDISLEQAKKLISEEKYPEARAALDALRKQLPAGKPSDAAAIDLASGKVERITGNVDTARGLLQHAVDALQDGSASRAEAHLQLSMLLKQQDDRVGARREATTAIEMYRKLGDRAGEGGAGLELAELYSLDNDFDSALRRLNEAETAFETANDRLGLANVRRARGSIERLRDRPQEAVALLTQARVAYRALESSLGEAQALWELGEAFAQLDQFDQARSSHLEAMRISQAIGYRLGVRNGYLALANLEAKRNRPAEATQEFRRAIDYFRSVNDSLGEAQAELGLGSVLIQTSDVAGASESLTRAWNKAMSLRDATIQSDIRWHQALITLQQGRADEAIAGFRQALALAQEAGDIAMQAKAFQGLSDALVMGDNKAEATKTLERARSLFQQAFMKPEAAISGFSLATLRLEQGDESGCTLLNIVIGELEGTSRLDVLQLARQVQKAGCRQS